MSVPKNAHELEFVIRMNIVYHEDIERLYRNIINWTSFTTIIFSSTAFITLSDLAPQSFISYKETIVAIVSFIVTVLNGAVLTFGLQEKIKEHIDLKKSWTDLMEKLLTRDHTEKNIRSIQKELMALNTIEPAPIQSRLNKAHRFTTEVMGLNKQ